MIINTKAIEERYKDIDLKINAIEDHRIEKLNYNMVTFEYAIEYLPMCWLGDEIFGIKEKAYLEDVAIVRVDRNLVQAVINKIDNLKKQYNL